MENPAPLLGVTVEGGKGKVQSTSNPIARPFAFRLLNTMPPMGCCQHVLIPVLPEESNRMIVIGKRTMKCKYDTAAM